MRMGGDSPAVRPPHFFLGGIYELFTLEPTPCSPPKPYTCLDPKGSRRAPPWTLNFTIHLNSRLGPRLQPLCLCIMNREPSDPESYFTGSTRTPPGRQATPSPPHCFLFRLLFTYWYLFIFLPSSLYPAEALPLNPTPACASQVQEEPSRVGRRRSGLEKAFGNGPGD